MSKFNKWFNRKYREFRGDKTGQLGSVAEFSRYLDISQPTVWTWLNTDTEPGTVENVLALVGKYGREVFDVLDIAIIDEIVRQYGEPAAQVAEMLQDVPPEKRGGLLEKIKGLIQQASQ